MEHVSIFHRPSPQRANVFHLIDVIQIRFLPGQMFSTVIPVLKRMTFSSTELFPQQFLRKACPWQDLSSRLPMVKSGPQVNRTNHVINCIISEVCCKMNWNVLKMTRRLSGFRWPHSKRVIISPSFFNRRTRRAEGPSEEITFQDWWDGF